MFYVRAEPALRFVSREIDLLAVEIKTQEPFRTWVGATDFEVGQPIGLGAVGESLAWSGGWTMGNRWSPVILCSIELEASLRALFRYELRAYQSEGVGAGRQLRWAPRCTAFRRFAIYRYAKVFTKATAYATHEPQCEEKSQRRSVDTRLRPAQCHLSNFMTPYLAFGNLFFVRRSSRDPLGSKPTTEARQNLIPHFCGFFAATMPCIRTSALPLQLRRFDPRDAAPVERDTSSRRGRASMRLVRTDSSCTACP